jgi:3-hydroxyacyl-CoA dehydrogenase/enoyl-CoA hydratase/3-hydroxybutyryl-CoA epimerase
VLSHEEIVQRLVYPLINEAARCLDEKICEKPDDIDLAMVFGTGFAPFRGGPITYARSRGLQACVARLHELEQRYGERFHPDAGWAQLHAETAGIA